MSPMSFISYAGRLVVMFALASAIVVAPAAPAAAHTELIGMSPAAGSSVSAAPREVTLTFNQKVQPAGHGVVVSSPGGQRVDAGPATVRAAAVSVSLRELPTRGVYRVSYRVVSADGHPVTGSRSFNFVPPATATDSSSPTHPAASASPAGPSRPVRLRAGRGQAGAPGLAVVAGGGIAALVVLCGAVLGARRRRARRDR